MADSAESQPPSPWKALYDNLGELMKAWKAANESTLGFHWKKIWPFSMFWPQVDFVRIGRIMDSTIKHTDDQIGMTKRLLRGAETMRDGEDLRVYYSVMIHYMEAFREVCTQLQNIAGMKQKKLAKGKVKLRAIYRTTATYDTAIQSMSKLGFEAHKAWKSLAPSRFSAA